MKTLLRLSWPVRISSIGLISGIAFFPLKNMFTGYRHDPYAPGPLHRSLATDWAAIFVWELIIISAIIIVTSLITHKKQS